eukprot:m.259027 g.259027  ORF g.259027 m.259027 type:complete len:778 (+) comp22129_c0_seq1:110-2443(+)
MVDPAHSPAAASFGGLRKGFLFSQKPTAPAATCVGEGAVECRSDHRDGTIEKPHIAERAPPSASVQPPSSAAISLALNATAQPAPAAAASLAPSRPGEGQVQGVTPKASPTPTSTSGAATSATASPPPMWGVHIEALRALRKKAPATITTAALCETIIKPATAADGGHADRPYTDLLLGKLASDKTPMVARATCFVSHAWAGPFAEAVECMEEHYRAHRGTYFWFDAVCNNQHDSRAKPFEWWCTLFKESIRAIGTMLVVASPWDSPLPITRAWCLFEMYSALDTEAAVKIAIPPSQNRGFIETLKTSFDGDCFTKIFMRLDLKNAEASRPEDQQQIFEVVRQQEGGFLKLNTTVKEFLRKQYLEASVAVVSAVVAKFAGVEDVSLLLNIASALHKHFGEHERALQVLEFLERTVLDMVRGTVKSRCLSNVYLNMGAVYNVMGKQDNAIRCYQQSREQYEIVAHISPVETYYAEFHNNIANAYSNKGDYQTALKHHAEALALRRRILGESHLDTASSYGNCAHTHYLMSNYDKAIELYRRALNIRDQIQGAKHPDTATVLDNLAAVYQCKGEYETALAYYIKTLTYRKASLGDHQMTFATHGSIGLVFKELGRLDNALKHLDLALAGSLRTLGPMHSATARAYSNKGLVLALKEMYPDAISCHTKALSTVLQIHPPNHPEIAFVQRSLGCCYNAAGDASRALDHLREALRINQIAIGENHRDTAETHASIAEASFNLGDRAAARRHARAALAAFEAVGIADIFPRAVSTRKLLAMLG